jgi:hypothetical protein
MLRFISPGHSARYYSPKQRDRRARRQREREIIAAREFAEGKRLPKKRWGGGWPTMHDIRGKVKRLQKMFRLGRKRAR